MKLIQTLFISTILFLIASQVFAQKARTIGKIDVEISGIDRIEGDISIGLFSNVEFFPEYGKAFNSVKLKVETSKVSYTFKDIPAGDYAIAVFHDENSNGELDKNFLGIPSEEYVFSNQASGTLGPPSFKDAMFTFSDSTKIKLNFNK